MNRKVKIAIIGAGTAGLSAYKEAKKYVDDILIIDNGPLGSTCARVGCMPSKLLIQAANFYNSRVHFGIHGIKGGEHLFVKIPEVLQYVRNMRDKFTASVVEFTRSLDKHFLSGIAKFITPNTLQVDDQTIYADKIIIASGVDNIIPNDWSDYRDYILTNENIFEQELLSNKIGLIGIGSIGLEFAQALSRLGIEISAFHSHEFIGGLSDPMINNAALKIFQKEFQIYLNEKASLAKKNGRLYIKNLNKAVDQVIVAIGVKSNVASLGLKELGVKFDDNGIPKFDLSTLQIQNYPIFIAGDVNKTRPLLHEAADEGRIAAYNALNEPKCFKRRTQLRVIFTEPNIVVVGKPYQELDKNKCVIGEVDFSDQGRAKIMHHNNGLLRLYGSKKEGCLLGAEMIAPDGEHLGHLLALAIEKSMTVFDLLKMPFYHPVLEEGVRTALRDLSRKVTKKSSEFDLTLCDSEAISSLS